MGASGRVTLNDVAAASGVARSTAGFVLTNDPNQTISAPTRERVRQAARELGYVPHGVARALREGSSRVVVLEIDWGFGEGNYARSYIRGLNDELAAHDYALLVRHGPHTCASTQQVLHAIAPRAVLRFAGPCQPGHHDLEDGGGGWKDGLDEHVELQICHLADRGHRRIALALPSEHHTPVTEARERLASHCLATLGLEPLVRLDVPRPREAGAATVDQLRRDHPDVTAIAAFSDDIALRTVTALQDLGLAVPGDIAVIGFDDTEYGALVTPALTTVHIDAEAHGRLAARAALGLDEAGLTPIPAHIIVRASA